MSYRGRKSGTAASNNDEVAEGVLGKESPKHEDENYFPHFHLKVITSINYNR